MLRDYQRKFVTDIYAAWQEPGVRNVMGVLPTGGGKTVCFSQIVKDFNGGSACLIAHRNELVSQIALTLNREEIPHGIIAPDAVIRQIVALEIDTYGKSFYKARAHARVAGVDTLIRSKERDRWFDSVKLTVVDEGHHVTNNKWARAMAMFPQALGFLPTAHAIRADGAGLGRHADGLVDRLVVGPSCRELINRGFLVDYRLICPPSDVDVSDVHIGPSGEFNQKEIRTAIHKSKTIVGDVAAHYLKFAAGKLGITFAVDIEAAKEIAQAYRAAGVPAEIITGDTPIDVRGKLMKKFRNRELLQLVSVDVLGEGVDVPAVEVVSMARHTASFQLFAQQFGRALRINVSEDLQKRWDTFTDEQRLDFIAASKKPHAIIIDHVNNWQRHGLPDRAREYSLDKVERSSRRKAPDDAIGLRVCTNDMCLQPFERILLACPWCGTPIPPPARRGAAEHVDGDLIELDPEVLRELRGEIERIDSAPRIPQNVSPMVAQAIRNKHHERQQAQQSLRGAIALWAGWQRHLGRNDREGHKKFFLQFGIDVATAQTLGSTQASDLERRVSAELLKHNVVIA